MAFPPAGNYTFRVPCQVEAKVPTDPSKDHASVVYLVVPLIPKYIATLNSQLANAQAYRITSVRIMGEPCTSTSTITVGIGNASSLTSVEGESYGGLSYEKRRSNRLARSSVGGELDVTWPIPGRKWLDPNPTDVDGVPSIILAINDFAIIKKNFQAWFEIVCQVQIMGRAP